MGGSRRSRGTTLAAHPHLVAGAVLAACVFAYLWPVLVGGKILSPIADLYQFVPWKGYAPADLHSYYNPLLLDLPVVDYPWRFLVRELLHKGTLPAWNPYVLGGAPLYSNSQTGLFSLFNVPLWILPLTYGLGVSAALKLLAGALGAYALARQLRLGLLAGLLAGIAFAFAAINIVWLAHETLPAVTVMVPWALWLVERIFERRRPGSAIALAVVTAVGLGGGHPGMQVHLLVVTAVYALVRAAFTPRGERHTRLRALALVGGGLAAGALLMAFMLIPEARGTHDTVGVTARHTRSLPGSNLPFATFRTVLFPDWWGRPSSVEAPGTPANIGILYANFAERTFYAGVVALLLAGVGLLVHGEWRRKAPFAIVGALGLAVALSAPGLRWLTTHLPVLDSVESQRLHLAFALAVAVLAAFGLQALIDGGVPRWAWAALSGGVALVAALAVTTSGLSSALHDTETHFLHGTNFADQGVLALTSVAWFALFGVAVCAALLLARMRPRWRVGIATALVLLAALDSYHFVHGFQPMGPQSRVIPPVTPAIRYLIAHRADGRIVGLSGVLPNDWPLVYGLRDVRGYDPPQPTPRMLALWREVEPQQVSWKPFSLPSLTPASIRVLGVLGARYVVAEPGVTVRGSPAAALRAGYAGSDATVIQNATAAPRALVPATVALTPGPRATRARIVEAAFDPRTAVAVEAGQPGTAALAGAHGSATIVREGDASVTLRATLDRRGLVMLDDQLLDGWSVRVDGRPATPLRVDAVMRGVVVPAGSHEIEWRYKVPGLRLGVLVSLLTLAALVACALALRRRSRRR